MDPRNVSPSDHADVFHETIRRLQSTYACILALDEQGRSVTKGTAVFVSVGSQSLLVTARHVVRSKRIAGCTLVLLLSRLGADGLSLIGEQTLPVTVPLNLQIVWESESLDMVFLRAPTALSGMAEARFFDAIPNADAATAVRGQWREHHSDTTSLPYFVLGFPDFGHLIEDSQRVETLSTTVLPAYVTQFDRHPWDGHTMPAPQLLLEVDAREDGLVIGARSSLQMAISQKLFHASDGDPDPLGGFSGGPVVVVSTDGEFLLGLIKEGTEVFGSLRVAASCWDDCLRAYARSSSANG